MHIKLQEFARSEILKGLNNLTKDNRLLFKRMYSHQNLDAKIEDVVAAMPEESLDNALRQVETTLERRDDT